MDKLPAIIDLFSLRYLSFVWNTQIVRKKTCSILKSTPQPIKSEFGHCFQESILNNRSTTNFQDKQLTFHGGTAYPPKIALFISHSVANTIEKFKKYI